MGCDGRLHPGKFLLMYLFLCRPLRRSERTYMWYKKSLQICRHNLRRTQGRSSSWNMTLTSAPRNWTGYWSHTHIASFPGLRNNSPPPGFDHKNWRQGRPENEVTHTHAKHLDWREKGQVNFKVPLKVFPWPRGCLLWSGERYLL